MPGMKLRLLMAQLVTRNFFIIELIHCGGTLDTWLSLVHLDRDFVIF